MSRIHEALRKAEEERNHGHKREDILAVPETPAVAEFAEASVAKSVAERDRFGAAAEPSDHSPFSVASLRERCSKPEWHPDATRMLFLNRDTSHALGMEEFRTLRSRLYRIREKRPLKTILVGSAVPGEGKSFVCSNLAQTLARQYGRRVLLIDGDLRKSRLHTYLGAPLTPGLLDYLRGDADEYAVIQQSPLENMFFIPGGAPESNPAELVSNGRLKHLIEAVASTFEWIVIDSPPVVPVSDAGLMSQCVDGVLMVIDSGRTPADVAQRARLEFKDRPLLGVVLNRVRSRGLGSYYYGRYGYGYGYGYGSGAAPKVNKG